jgi:hypothetical protein
VISNWKVTTTWWDGLWFTPKAPESLALTRVICGLVAIVHFASLVLDGSQWFGRNGWLNVDAGRFLIGENVEGTGSFYRWSILYWFPDSLPIVAGVGLLASLGMIAGIGSRLSPFIVWFCLCTFHHRAPLLALIYEPLLVAFTAYMTIDPGRLAWFRPGLASGDSRISVNIVAQLIQCHLWIWIAFSLSSMLSHPIWWNGEACWLLIEQGRGWLTLPDGWQWIGQLLTHGVIASQAGVLFCMNQKASRWLGRWMLYVFIASVLLLLNDWMYASLLVAAGLIAWPVPFPHQISQPKHENAPT